MKLFALLTLLTFNAYAADCFIMREDNTILTQEGDCAERHSPYCTFNIAMSVMGYNHNILIDEDDPVHDFQEGYVDYVPSWKQSHTPKSWMDNSVVWYTQVIAARLGKEIFEHDVKKFEYGNMDVSGDKGFDNGLTRSWLGSSLQISPIEQITFLHKLAYDKLPVNKHAMIKTRAIIFKEELPEHWRLYGKTGGTFEDLGWFVGWVDNTKRKIFFASYVDKGGAPKAKEIALERVKALVYHKPEHAGKKLKKVK